MKSLKKSILSVGFILLMLTGSGAFADVICHWDPYYGRVCERIHDEPGIQFRVGNANIGIDTNNWRYYREREYDHDRYW